MALHISVAEAGAWTEPSKLPVSAIDVELDRQISELVFASLSQTFDTSGWTSASTTPKLVRTIIAMHYIAWLYDKHYAQDEEESAYANTLRRYADANIAGLIAGTVTLVEFPPTDDTFTPSFFPNDASSANAASTDFPSDGPPSFMMGTVF